MMAETPAMASRESKGPWRASSSHWRATEASRDPLEGHWVAAKWRKLPLQSSGFGTKAVAPVHRSESGHGSHLATLRWPLCGLPHPLLPSLPSPPPPHQPLSIITLIEDLEPWRLLRPFGSLDGPSLALWRPRQAFSITFPPLLSLLLFPFPLFICHKHSELNSRTIPVCCQYDLACPKLLGSANAGFKAVLNFPRFLTSPCASYSILTLSKPSL